MRRILPLAAIVSLIGCSPGDWARPGETRTEPLSIDKGKTEMAKIDVTMGAGQLQLRGGAAKLAEGTFTYNVDAWKPEVRFDNTGFRGHLTIKQGGPGSNAGGNVKNEWDIRIADDVETDLTVNLGAGESELNLGSVKLRSAEVHIGAGRCTLDLRGTPQRSSEIHIRGGVGEAKVWVPQDVGVIAEAQGGLGEIDVRGLHKDGNSWTNDLYGKAKNTIRLDVRGGIGSIQIRAE